MMRIARALALVAAALLADGCGSSSKNARPEPQPEPTTTAEPGPTTGGGTTTAAPAPPTPSGQTTIRLYLLRAGKLAVVSRTVPAAARIARAALTQLQQGPTPAERNAGFTTSLTANTVERLTIANGVATLDTSARLRPDRELGQVVYTLTQFPTVKRVSVVLETNDSGEFGRGDFEQITPPILIESPTPGDQVTSPLRATGTANTFEATFFLELREQDGSLIAKKLVTATSGSGTRGTFDATLPYRVDRSGLRELVAYEIDADRGTRTHVVRVPLVLRAR